MNPTEMQITREMFAIQAEQKSELLAALIALKQQLHAHVKLDVKRHYSLMVADAAAGTAIAKAIGK